MGKYLTVIGLQSFIKPYFFCLGCWLCLLGTLSAQPAAPSNMVRLYDSLFVDISEVANLHYLEYLSDIRRDSGEAYFLTQLPDSQFIAHPTGSLLEHPAYRFRPVIGLSYTQVLNFCRWRSAKATQIYNQRYAKGKQTYTLTYRLPTAQEWMVAAAGGLDPGLYPFGLTHIELVTGDTQPKTLINHKADRLKHFVLEDVYAGLPNPLGVFHAAGNVAEMLQEEGVAKGGSWWHRLEDCKLRHQQQYDRPQAWLGFRNVCIIRLNNP